MITTKEPAKATRLFSKNSLRFNNRSLFLFFVLLMVVKAFLFHENFYILDIEPWHTQELTMDYSFGFIRRGLLGSWVTLIKDALKIHYQDAILIVQNLGVLLFFSAILLFFHRLLKNENEKSFFFIILLYMALDHIGFELTQFGLLDTYMMAITLLMVYLIIKDKALFLIPFLTGICVLIHEGYPMMFFGIIVALLIYRLCYAEDNKSKYRYIGVLVLSGLIAGVLFFFCYFVYPRITNHDIETVFAFCKQKLSNDDFDASNIRYFWFDKTLIPGTREADGRMWVDGHIQKRFFILMRIVLLNVVVCSPLIVMTFLYWQRIIKNESKPYRKILLTLCSLSVLLIFPLIIIHCDQGRWFYDIVFFEIVVISSISLLNRHNERNTLAEMSKFSVIKVLMLSLYFIFYFHYTDFDLGNINYINYICINIVRLYRLFFS